MSDSELEQGPIARIVLDQVFFTVFQVLEKFVGDARKKFPGMDLGPLGEPDVLLKLAIGSWEDPETDGMKSALRVADWFEGKLDRDEIPFFLCVIDTVLAYSTQAMKTEERGNISESAAYLASARHWEGVLTSLFWFSPAIQAINAARGHGHSSAAAKLAQRRHARSAAEKQKIVDYWKSNLDPSMSASKAATHIVTNCNFSLEFRTIQTLISEAKKAKKPS